MPENKRIGKRDTYYKEWRKINGEKIKEYLTENADKIKKYQEEYRLKQKLK